MALSDLHRHLDGSLRRATVAELAGARDLAVPEPLVFQPGMGLDAALACFAFTLRLLDTPDIVTRVASEICEDAEADGVTTLEIRFAPQLHGSVDTFVRAALDGIDGRAGLLLCGLYGEDPAVLHRLLDHAREGVVGLDLAGAPLAEHRFGLADYADAFTRARSMGLGRTVHAGEGRSASEIRIAVEKLHAQRIGHGTALLDDLSVLDLVRERDVTIEACPTSNVHTGAIDALSDHPLPRWLDCGVRCCINTDNTLFSDVSASEEHARAARIPGMTADHLAQAVSNGRRAAFHSR